ncbi:MAG: UbiA family prenyltransferase [Candidatus Bathyarchaeota archaeon]|nr:UbiA family prenyltransferase [Candidatus Bathyarchaeum tardum]
MRNKLKGFLSFISFERGIMLFMINMGATFLIAKSSHLPDAVYLGIIAFFLWSGVDAINNVYDVDLDVKSDPKRAEYTKNLGKLGLAISLGLFAVTLSLGAATGILSVVMFIFIGIFAGVIYSVPPFRLRQTIYKPIVNLSVGAVPVLIVAAFYNVFSIQIFALILLMGISTAVNSLWEDLADYKSDFTAKAKTTLVVLGFKRGLYLTIILGYSLIPLMIIVGILFQLNTIYFAILAALITFISIRLIQSRQIITGKPKQETMLKAGESFARDFVIVALVHTTNLMISGYLTFQPIITV